MKNFIFITLFLCSFFIELANAQDDLCSLGNYDKITNPQIKAIQTRYKKINKGKNDDFIYDQNIINSSRLNLMMNILHDLSWRKKVKKTLGPHAVQLRPVPSNAFLKSETKGQAFERLSRNYPQVKMSKGLIHQNLNQDSKKIIPALKSQIYFQLAKQYLEEVQSLISQTPFEIELTTITELSDRLHKIWVFDQAKHVRDLIKTGPSSPLEIEHFMNHASELLEKSRSTNFEKNKLKLTFAQEVKLESLKPFCNLELQAQLQIADIVLESLNLLMTKK